MTGKGKEMIELTKHIKAAGLSHSSFNCWRDTITFDVDGGDIAIELDGKALRQLRDEVVEAITEQDLKAAEIAAKAEARAAEEAAESED